MLPGKVTGIRVEDPPVGQSLTAADLTYVGTFALGPTIAGQDYSLGKGMTLRRVNGELRVLFSPWSLVELKVPTTLGTAAKPTQATIVKSWGPVPNPNNPFGSLYGPVGPLGLFWDEPTHSLFYSLVTEYNAKSGTVPTIGVTTLNSDGTITTRGPWGLLEGTKRRSCKMLSGGLTPVPDWFARQYTNGRRMACGFGGYFSIATTGPISMGPALAAFDPELLVQQPALGAVPCTPLVSYPFGLSCQSRANRDTDVIDDFDHCPAGKWIWNDKLWQGGLWIDTPTKSGFLCAPTLGNGRGWYYNSTLNSERGSHAWLIYDPADLADVAEGRAKAHEIQPAFTTVQYPGVSYPIPGWAGDPPLKVVGMAQDGNLVYIALQRAWKQAVHVHVYQVA